jgi:hypothetical protein
MAVKRKTFASAMLAALLAAFFFGSAFKPSPVDLKTVGARLAGTLFADHLKSFSALEDLLQVYLESYRGAMQESLLVQPRWLDELRNSGDLVGEVSGSRSQEMTLHGGRRGLRYYIDGKGAFHCVRALGGGKSRADVVIGFGPLQEAVNAMAKRPRSVALIDTVNGTTALVYGRERGWTGIPETSGSGTEIRLGRIGRIGVSRGFDLDGGGLVLVAEYGFPSPAKSVILWGLFVVFTLAILVVAGAALFGITIPGGGVMQGATGDSDIVNQIDREIAGASRGGPETAEVKTGSKVPEEGAETPETEQAEEAALSIDRGLEETEAVPGAAARAGGGRRRKAARDDEAKSGHAGSGYARSGHASDVLEQDGIKIKKS